MAQDRMAAVVTVPPRKRLRKHGETAHEVEQGINNGL